MPLFQIDPGDATPIYAQIERAIKTAVATGKLAVGAQLPTVRQLAVDLAVNANTVARVYAQLERDGMLGTQRGIGTFVREKPSSDAIQTHRKRELKQITQRFIRDGSALGFTIHELINQLQKEEKR